MIYARIDGGSLVTPIGEVDILRGSVQRNQGLVNVSTGSDTSPVFIHAPISFFSGGLTGVVTQGGPNWSKVSGKLKPVLADGQNMSGDALIETKSTQYTKRGHEPMFIRMTFRFTGSVSIT